MTLARLPFPPRGRLRSFSRNLIAAGVAAATLLVAGCEEMMSEEGESRPSEAAALQNVRKELGVPAGVQVVKVKSSSNTVTYMLRNPGASETSGQSVAGTCLRYERANEFGATVRYTGAHRAHRPGDP